jgi:ABC-2 type transport system ATP-binding protein
MRQWRPARAAYDSPVSVIEVVDLVKRYGDKTAVDGVSLHVDAGEIVAMLGPNGAGKSTTVNVMTGFLHRNGGEVRVLDDDPATAGSAWRDRVGVVMQDVSVVSELTVRESLTHFAAYYRSPRDVTELIASVGLDEKADMRASRLSGGQRRRLDVAMGLIGRPELVFLDEPTTGFDPEVRRQFWQLIRSIRDDGASVLLTTHYLDEAEALADRAVVLAGGRVVAEGPPASLGGRDVEPCVVQWTEQGEARSLRTDMPTAVITELAARFGGEVPDLRVARPTLEDVYLRLIGAEHALHGGTE